MKVNQMHKFSYLFDKVLYMFRTSSLSIISILYTVIMQQVYVTLVPLSFASVVSIELKKVKWCLEWQEYELEETCN